MNCKGNCTRDKILEVASRLFANNGFKGTSVRDIALAAQVNVAAINYHFQNKQNLYHEIFELNCQWLGEMVAALAIKYPNNTILFVKNLYLLLLQNSHLFLNSLKLILDENVPIPNEDNPSKALGHIGPPGGERLFEVISHELGANVPLASKEWAVRCIFGQVIHLAIIRCSSVGAALSKTGKPFSQDNIECHLELFTKCILEFIQNNPNSSWPLIHR